MEIRKLNEHDATEFKEIYLRSVIEHPEAFYPTREEVEKKPLQEYRELLRISPYHWFLGAIKDHQLVGMIAWKNEKEEKFQHKSKVYSIYVVPEARKMGIGRALVEGVIQRVKQLERVEQIQLGVGSTNPAKRLYRSCGFINYGYEKEGMRIYESHYVDIDLMVYFIKN